MLPGSFTQIYIQIVIVVKGRRNQISPEWEEKLHKYITSIIQNKGQKLLAINGMPDHLHMLIGMSPNCILSDLIREIKKSSNTYVNSRQLCKGEFAWQSGYGAFSYAHSSLDNVIGYINRQKEYHAKKSTKQEYLELLKEFEVEFDEQFLFEWS